MGKSNRVVRRHVKRFHRKGKGKGSRNTHHAHLAKGKQKGKSKSATALFAETMTVTSDNCSPLSMETEPKQVAKEKGDVEIHVALTGCK